MKKRKKPTQPTPFGKRPLTIADYQAHLEMARTQGRNALHDELDAKARNTSSSSTSAQTSARADANTKAITSMAAMVESCARMCDAVSHAMLDAKDTPR